MTGVLWKGKDKEEDREQDERAVQKNCQEKLEWNGIQYMTEIDKSKKIWRQKV